VKPGQDTVRWLNFKLAVQLNSLTINKKPYQGASRVGELTEAGIGLMIPAKLRKHDLAQIEFSLPDTSELKVSAVLRTINGFRYWFEFVDLKPKQLERIQKTIGTAALAEAKK
jgi:hypothetical protein